MKTRTTLAAVAAALLAGGTALAAAAPAAASSGDPVTLSYFTFSAAPDHLEDLDAIIAAFEAANPNITIEVQTAAYADYFTSLQTQIAGGSAPDTFELNYENFVTYARSGALLDLSDLVTDPDRYYPLALRGLPGRRHAVRLAGHVLRRRAVLQQGPVRRRRPRLPDRRLDLGRRAGRGREAHRQRRRRVRRLPADQLLRVLQGAGAVRRCVLRRRPARRRSTPRRASRRRSG